jgi:hypothetical protein
VGEAGAEAKGNWAMHQLALHALGATLETLGAAGVPVLVVKAMVLAYALYDEAAGTGTVVSRIGRRP